MPKISERSSLQYLYKTCCENLFWGLTHNNMLMMKEVWDPFKKNLKKRTLKEFYQKFTIGKTKKRWREQVWQSAECIVAMT